VQEQSGRLRDTVCPAYLEAAERDLVLAMAPVLHQVYLVDVGILDPTGAVVVAIGWLVVRYGLDKLCEGYGGGTSASLTV
jgi:hypothetical protein